MFYKLIEILLSIVALLPVFIVLDKIKFHSIKKTTLYFVFAIYLAAVYSFVGMPTVQFMRFELTVNLIPFIPMIADFKNTILNVILFIPLGVMLPFLWNKYNTLKSTIIFGFVMTLSIEVLQILTYRATDINDIIANTLGTLLGYCIFSITSKLLPSITKFSRKENDVSIILIAVSLVMFFIQPYLATLYYRYT